MGKLRVTLLLSICLVVSAAAPQSHAASPTLEPGYYYNLHYIVSASATGTGQCVDPVGTYYTSSTYYPGPSKKGFTDWRAFNGAGGVAEVVATFPETQPAGVADWSGTYTTTLEPGGKPMKASFSSTASYADAHSSISTGTFTYPVTGGTCTTTIQDNLLPQGR